MGPTGRSRILQIHPTRVCNLRCLHCYSSSGPEQGDSLPGELLRSAFSDARDEGYTVVGFSGGEPLLYRALPDVLDHARDLGLFTTVTSNGMLLDQRRLDGLSGRVDLLAISLDGRPGSHNRMRANPRAFDVMAQRLEGVRSSGIPFGFIFTLTQHNLDELPWVADFAMREGAALLQVHPLEIAGRAREALPGERPDEHEAAWAFVATRALEQQLGDRLKVQLDLLDARLVRQHPGRIFADGPAAISRPLGELLTPLVLEADGTLVPIQYGFPRAYALGDLKRESLRRCAERWKRTTAADFYALCRSVYDELGVVDGLPIVNWYERLSRRAAGDREQLVSLGVA